MYDSPNLLADLKLLRKNPIAEKVEAIKDVLKQFWVI